ncbi:MAG: site-2 protease family protein [Chloroflexota bacterium]
MGTAFKLFTVSGIAIRMHITFPLILIWAAIQFGYLAGAGWVGALFGVIVVTLLFVIVTLHELGHSYAALFYGVPVKQIVLLPIGGVAQLKRIPENPTKEFVIAIAGPAVNFGLAIVLWLVAWAFNLPLFADPIAILEGMERITFEHVFIYVFIYNIFLAVFNLLPAFPMDGGRVLRAVLATRLEYSRATSISATVGRAMAWLLGLYGFLGGGFFLIIIAFFIYIGASQEEAQVKTRTLLRGLTVADAYSRQARSLPADSTLADAIQLTLTSLQASFPICEEERLVGMLTYPKLVEALNGHNAATPVSEVMVRDVEAVAPDDDLFEVQLKLQGSQLDTLPVMANGRFLGIITNRDINEVYRLLSIDPDILDMRRSSWESDSRADAF